MSDAVEVLRREIANLKTAERAVASAAMALIADPSASSNSPEASALFSESTSERLALLELAGTLEEVATLLSAIRGEI